MTLASASAICRLTRRNFLSAVATVLLFAIRHSASASPKRSGGAGVERLSICSSSMSSSAISVLYAHSRKLALVVLDQLVQVDRGSVPFPMKIRHQCLRLGELGLGNFLAFEKFGLTKLFQFL